MVYLWEDSRYGRRKAVETPGDPYDTGILVCRSVMEELRHHDNCAKALQGERNSGLETPIA
jgi:hypothetical protein